jgi:hypothetical protein
MNDVAPILKNPFDEQEFTAGNQKKSAWPSGPIPISSRRVVAVIARGEFASFLLPHILPYQSTAKLLRNRYSEKSNRTG